MGPVAKCERLNLIIRQHGHRKDPSERENRVAADRVAVSKADNRTDFSLKSKKTAGGDSRRFFVFDTFAQSSFGIRQSYGIGGALRPLAFAYRLEILEFRVSHAETKSRVYVWRCVIFLRYPIQPVCDAVLPTCPKG